MEIFNGLATPDDATQQMTILLRSWNRISFVKTKQKRPKLAEIHNFNDWEQKKWAVIKFKIQAIESKRKIKYLKQTADILIVRNFEFVLKLIL